MKQLAGTFLLSITLLSCQHHQDPTPLDPTPAPTLLGEPWVLQTEEVEITPLDSSAAYVRTLPPRTGPLTLRYVDAEHFTQEVQFASGAPQYHLESTYAYQGQALTFARIYSRVAGKMMPRTMRVTALSAHQLVLVEVWENANTHYFTTQTYSR